MDLKDLRKKAEAASTVAYAGRQETSDYYRAVSPKAVLTLIDQLEVAQPNELRVAALAHAVECYSGPDDDTLPVLRDWLHALVGRAKS